MNIAAESANARPAALSTPSGAAPIEIFVPFVSSVIPVAVKLDGIIVGANLLGVDRQTQELADGFEAQLRCALEVMRDALQVAGAGLQHVAHVTVYFRHMDLKPTLNQVWTELYPDPNDRPPHKYVPVHLPAGQEAQVSFVAVEAGPRKVLEIPGMSHVDPMSMGVVAGGLLFSSRIVGTDTRTGAMGEGAERQAELALENVRTLLGQVGADPSALTQVTAFITGEENLAAIEKPWRSMFPQGSVQPELRIVETDLPGTAYVRLEVKGRI